MDNNILKLIGVGVVAYYFLKNKETKKTGVAPVSPDVIRPVTSTPVTTPVTTTPDTPTDNVVTDPIVVTPEGIKGCQDPSATNFNSLANTPCDSSSTVRTRGFNGESYEDGGLFINSDY